VVHTLAVRIIHAPPPRVMDLYLDYMSWPQLFPATVRGVQLLGVEGGRTRVEVDHAVDGKVLNVLTVVSANEVRLDEWKSRYEATFMSRFEPHPKGTRYSVFAEVALKGPLWLLTPLAAPVVRARLDRFVLRPMKTLAEKPARGALGQPLEPPVETRPR
jgi:hypothetical protein